MMMTHMCDENLGLSSKTRRCCTLKRKKDVLNSIFKRIFSNNVFNDMIIAQCRKTNLMKKELPHHQAIRYMSVIPIIMGTTTELKSVNDEGIKCSKHYHRTDERKSPWDENSGVREKKILPDTRIMKYITDGRLKWNSCCVNNNWQCALFWQLIMPMMIPNTEREWCIRRRWQQ